MKFGAIILAATFASTSALTIPAVRKQIGGLTKENFDATLKEVEPFLLNEAGASFYAKTMRRIGVQATELGATVPADFAKDAKATKKQREKQDAFIQAKVAEAAEAAKEEAAESEESETSE
mmetsp:Transcript_2560/g.5766  ORF Transcript_2560/g.5766 Transcript_2560/m.5766 type:complete len:121 (-) Transcript_2560:90-452(-)|eukprot:CAMPEP_0201167240 /NCGR_PEP_ID=MMETSP0851-20130426/71607_1 /ASSEMBLY_ACC=CAM_ASM_000631 /TAXON_ID=183588 /ORGANISM="Pseudo-nitzschia fraudulenta, Strain WWA7" /LENGTH=120 /DNA_ID=CAMNT_0047448425 /DNA_START=155 /DNA_END=517 /DNA_ORIENTATION=+